MQINLIHKNMTDEETYQSLKLSYVTYPTIVMNPEKWRELRLQQIKQEGKLWSS